jgi:hypothetical protein
MDKFCYIVYRDMESWEGMTKPMSLHIYEIQQMTGLRKARNNKDSMTSHHFPMTRCFSTSISMPETTHQNIYNANVSDKCQLRN